MRPRWRAPEGSALRTSLFILGCHREGAVDLGLELQRWDGGAWEAVWMSERPLCVTPPVEVPPGGTLRDTVRVEVCTSPRCGPPAAGLDPDGAYRFRWTNLVVTRDGRASGEPVRLDEAYLRSNTFALRGR